jgi:hypothetical protein
MLDRIIQRLSKRPAEWFLAALDAYLGVWLLRPAASMDAPAFAAMTDLMTEDTWGSVLLLSSAVQFAALWVNGGRGWTPYARCAAHMTGFAIFWIGAWAFYVVDKDTSGVPIWGALAVAHLLAACGAVAQLHYRRLTRRDVL